MQLYFKLPFLIIIGFLLTILLTWPLINKITTFYPDVSDYALVGWILWYNQHSIITGSILDQQAYFSTNQFYPSSYTLAYSESLFIPSLIFAPIFWLSKNLIFSVNYFAMLTFVFSFVSSFYCLNFFLKNKLAAFIGAFVFTFNPITFAHFSGHHLQLMNKFFLPPLFLFAYLYIKQVSWKNAFFFFLFFTLNALSSVYFQIFSLIFVPILWGPFLLAKLVQKDLNFFVRILKTSLVFLFFLPLLLYFNLPYLQFSSLEGVSRNLKENAYFSGRGIDWISSLRTNLVYGKFVKSLDYLREPTEQTGFFNYTEHTLFLNLVPILLTIIGLSNLKKSPIYLVFFSMAIIAALFTFGPYFYGWNGKLTITASTSIYYSLHQTLTIFQGLRVPTRFQFIFYLPFALFAAFGAKVLLKISGKLSLITFGLICSLLVLENINQIDFNLTSPTLEYLKSEQTNQSQFINLVSNKKTAHFPIFTTGAANNVRYLNWSTVTNEIIVNGYSGYYPREWGDLVQKINNLDEQALQNMKLLGLDYIIIHKDLLDKDSTISYYKNINLLDKGLTFQDDKIKVIDLKRFSFYPTFCHIRDIMFEIQTTSFPVAQIQNTTFQLFPKITLKNPKNCYLINRYQDRYSRVDLLMNNKKISIPVKLPVIITPYQKINLN